MMKQFTEGIDKVYAGLDGLDNLKSKLHVEVAVPDPVPGRPWVHTDDDFILFLEWLIRQEGETGESKYTVRNIVDLITSPTDDWVVELYQSYIAQRNKEEADPYL